MTQRDWRARESEQLALIVMMAQRIVDGAEGLTDMDDGFEKAMETRQALYTNVELCRKAIVGLYEMHREVNHDA